MRISIVHSQRPARQVLTRALAVRLKAEVVDFPHIDDLLTSSMNYDVFILYSNLGPGPGRMQRIPEIRKLKPNAFVIAVTYVPNSEHKYRSLGADAVLLRAGNEIEELTNLIQKRADRAENAE